MTATEIDRIVCMSEAQYQDALAAAIAAEQEAYNNYCGYMPGALPGTPAAVGHGTQVGGFVGQGEWYAAQRRLAHLKAARTAWVVESISEEEATYCTTKDLVPDLMAGCDLRHQLTIETHGVDVRGAKNPAEAIALVRAHAAA